MAPIVSPLLRRRQNALVPICLASVAFTACVIVVAGRYEMLHPGPMPSAGLWIVTIVSTMLTALIASAQFARTKLSDLRARAKESDRHQARFLALAAGSVDAVFVLVAQRNTRGEIEDFSFSFLNQNAYNLLALPPETLLHGRACQLLPFFSSERLIEQYKSIVLTGKPSVDEFAIDQVQVRAKWLRISASKFEDGVLLAATDLTEQKRFEKQLCDVAHHDELTKLPNRTLLDDRIQQTIERAKRNGHHAAVLILDIDDFKHVNDSHGRAAGDHVLKTVATRLLQSARSSDSVFRLGGDEFVIVFSDISTRGPVVDFARKVVISLLAPIAWNDRSIGISVSVGAAMYPASGTTPETLLVQADIEMYRMKREHAAAKVIVPRAREYAGASAFSLNAP